MGYSGLSLSVPTDYDEESLRRLIGRELGISDFTFEIEQKSLDARKKTSIHWLLKLSVLSDELKGELPSLPPTLDIPSRKRDKRVIVAGSGPSGFFSALVLQKAGFETVILERGAEAEKRAEGIKSFEKTAIFNPLCNYAFGEGGAGTFSDGKLTSRSKHITREKQFIFSAYIRAGAPKEIAYMTHPHLGSDNLRKIVRNLRDEFLSLGGTVLFETLLEDLVVEGGRVREAVISSGRLPADYFIMAPGHSAYETYRMLIARGVRFSPKGFAVGSRVEHPRELINRAQWGHESLPGLKAAEYRLSSSGGKNRVYTFCMCPGGFVVPASAYDGSSVVNGMSRYGRNERFSNAACVAAVHPDELAGRTTGPLEALDLVEALERGFYNHTGGFDAPFSSISDFIRAASRPRAAESSYPLGLKQTRLWELLPGIAAASMREGLKEFCRKIRGFETGIILGLESKTSSPIQALREAGGRCAGFENLYITGEGSGHSGGIVSSAADGIKAALHIAES